MIKCGANAVNPEVVRADLDTLLGLTNSSRTNISQAADAATEMARSAFQEGEPDAAASAERLLYVIHERTHFAPPIQGLSAAIWSSLMTAKLESILARYEVVPLDAAAMAQRIQAAVEEADQRDHPWIDEICSGEDLNRLRHYTKNWYASTHGFTHQLAGLAQRSSGVIKKAVVENLAGEFVDTPHPEMRARWPKRIGLDYSPNNALDDAEILTESFSLQNFRTGVCCLNDPTFGLGMFYSVEVIFPPLCARMVKGLRERGFEEKSFEIFTLHAELDVEHSDDFLDALMAQPFTSEERGRVVVGAMAQLDVRSKMFNGLKALPQN